MRVHSKPQTTADRPVQVEFFPMLGGYRNGNKVTYVSWIYLIGSRFRQPSSYLPGTVRKHPYCGWMEQSEGPADIPASPRARCNQPRCLLCRFPVRFLCVALCSDPESKESRDLAPF